MSLSIALQNALSGLQANQNIIQVISNNVTNANTDGYTRKSAETISRTLDFEGRGVTVSDISRVVDERLIADLRRTTAELGNAKTQDSYYQRVLDQFGTLADNSSLSANIADLATAFQTMAASPESSANRIEVITTAVALAQKLNSLSTTIQGLRFDADREITNNIDVINGELQKIADLNTKIAAGRALGEATGELEDFRDQALNKLSESLDIRYFERKSGEIVVTLPDGRLIVDRHARTLTHSPAGALSPDITYDNQGIGPILAGGIDVTPSIKSGEINALIQARDTILPQLQAELDTLTQKLRDEINALHNAGTGRPPPITLTGTRTFGNPTADQITLSSGVRIAVVDGSGNFVAYHDLAAGTYTIRQIEAAIDTNLSGFASASTSAGGPLSISATGAGNGIALVDLGPQTITHTDKVTTYAGFSNYFGLNDFFVTPGRVQGESDVGLAQRLQVRGDIVSDPARLSRGTLTSAASPAPKAGDPAISLGDASIAQAMADKFLEDLSFAAAGDLPKSGVTLAGYAAEILSDLSVSASGAKDAMNFKTTLSEQLSFRTQSVSGVNIDEELQNMMLFENAYTATARIVQTVNSMFDELVNLGR